MNTTIASFVLLLLSCSFAFAQKPVASGFYVGEGRSVSHGGNVYLLLKEFIPSDKKDQAKMREQGMQTYLDFPLEVEQVEVMGESFRSLLFCLDAKGKVRWKKELGTSNTSTPWGLAVDPFGMIYVGERDSTRLRIRKLNDKGKEVWKASVDSAITLHRVFADTSAFISALASHTVMHQVVEGETMRYEPVYLYRLLRVNRETGSVESNEFSGQLSSACAGGFSEPQLNEHWINYTYKSDSLLLYVNFRDEMLMVAQEELKGSTIVRLAGRAGETFVLAREDRPKEFRLLLDRFRPDEKFQKKLEVVVADEYYNILMCRNELNGVTIFFCGENRMEALKYDGKLDVLWRKDFDLKALGSDKVITATANDDGSYGIGYLTLEGQTRHVKFAVLSEKGEWKK